MALRLLVIEGNTAGAREGHRAGYGKTPSQSYADVLGEIAPDAICDICYPTDPGANLPDAGGLASYDGVAMTGSSLNVYDGGPEIMRQLDLARAVFASRTPFFGSCYGLQIAAAATGGDVVKNPRGRAVGIARNIAPNDAGRAHPLLAGRPAAFDAPCVHLDIVALPPEGAVILAGNAHTPIQAAEIRHDGGVFWGVQYHPEFSLGELAVIIRRRIPIFIAEGFFRDSAQGEAYCDEMTALHGDAARSDIAWRLGIQPEITDAHRRVTELRNWIAHFVQPEKSRRGRA